MAARKSHKSCRAFTLAEAMMATVVLGFAAAGVLVPFISGASVRAEGMRMTLAAKLAGDLVEQIISTPFDEIVSKYDGRVEPQGQVKDAAGVVFTDLAYSGFSRNAACQTVYVPQESQAAQPIFIRVTVGVSYNGRQMVTLDRLVSE